MASRKKPAARKRRTPKKRRAGGTVRLKRFLGVVAISSIASFSIVSAVLNPQWRDSVSFDVVRDGLSTVASWQADGVSLNRLVELFERSPPHNYGSVPFAAEVDGYDQTTFSQCPHFFPHSAPIVPAGIALRELCFSAFAILHNGHTKTPVFVAQRLNRAMLSRAPDIDRTDRFYAEARLPKSERAQLADYRGSGYSRGHMAPAGDMHTEDAMAQSFSLANMVPQSQGHNAGAWSRIESDTRKYVMRSRGDVYVFTGPIYDAQPETIGDGRVAVPQYLYKVVYDATTTRVWVHWHVHSDDTKAGRPITYDEFVRRTGLHLLPALHAD